MMIEVLVLHLPIAISDSTLQSLLDHQSQLQGLLQAHPLEAGE